MECKRKEQRVVALVWLVRKDTERKDDKDKILYFVLTKPASVRLAEVNL